MLDHLRVVKIFTKLALRSAYNLFWIKEREEDKTAFQKYYGQFEYRVMPFGPTNALATLQSYIGDFLWPYIDDFTVCYFDDILINSTNQKEHEEHVWQVL
jgi:hypothetical protein